MQIFSGYIAFARVALTCLQKNLIQFLEIFNLGFCKSHWQLGELDSIISGRHLVNDFAQSVNVSLGCTWSFRWDIASRSNKSGRLAGAGDKTNVRQLRLIVCENDV